MRRRAARLMSMVLRSSGRQRRVCSTLLVCAHQRVGPMLRRKRRMQRLWRLLHAPCRRAQPKRSAIYRPQPLQTLTPVGASRALRNRRRRSSRRFRSHWRRHRSPSLLYPRLLWPQHPHRRQPPSCRRHHHSQHHSHQRRHLLRSHPRLRQRAWLRRLRHHHHHHLRPWFCRQRHLPPPSPFLLKRPLLGRLRVPPRLRPRHTLQQSRPALLLLLLRHRLRRNSLQRR